MESLFVVFLSLFVQLCSAQTGATTFGATTFGSTTFASTSCIPDCTNRNCGNDGCGGSCGTCLGNSVCNGFTCCTPICDGQQCGNDGCGGSCGNCSEGFVCLENGQCSPLTTTTGPVCTPICDGRECGDDNCGGSCGTCSPNSICENFVCVAPCTPNCTGRQCGDNGCGGSCGTCAGNFLCDGVTCTCSPICDGRECGDDGCGGSCGTCSGNSICEGFTCSCTPICDGRECGDNGCGGSCGTCSGNSICENFVCVAPCTPDCTGLVCGDNGCGGSCGTCSSDQYCVNGVCSTSSCACSPGQCGQPSPVCPLCGLCNYGQFCYENSFCSIDWITSFYVVAQAGNCPSGAGSSCFVGQNALMTVSNLVSTGDIVQVGPGNYCGGFTISTEGVWFSGQTGATIVPCSSSWWPPAPPSCQAVDGASGTPCTLANNLITVNASSVIISGFTFDGQVPNPLFSGSPSIEVFSRDGTPIGAGRAITNWVASSVDRTFTEYPVLTVTIRNNTFRYFQDSAIRFKTSTLTVQWNTFEKVGTMGSVDGKRQSQTEKNRGARKDNPGAPVVLDNSSGDVLGNNASTCDYGGMDGGNYPPSSFPFKKRVTVVYGQPGRQLDYSLTQWAGNVFMNMTFGGLIVEDKLSGTDTLYGNALSGSTGRGFIIENNTLSSDSSLQISQNTMQGFDIAHWLWGTSGAYVSEENYQFLGTGFQVLSCNQYETEVPLASSNVNLSAVDMTQNKIGYLVQDEPSSNPLCSATAPVMLTMTVAGGDIVDSSVGLQTVGDRLDASDMYCYTQFVTNKIVVLPNSAGFNASASSIPPVCPVNCSGNGMCAGINVCQCNLGYYENNCAVTVCGDGICTTGENMQNCPADCSYILKKTTVLLQFGGMIPTPSCCSVPGK